MKKIIVPAIIIVLCVSTIVISVFKYNDYRDKIEGNFFRKMYGSIGIADNDLNYTFRIDLLNFNSDVEFLKDVNKLSFDNGNIKIINVNCEEQSAENDLIIYSVYLTISINQNGRYDISNLIYNNDGNEEIYPIGKLSIVYKKDSDDTYLTYGCDTEIINKKSTFTFLGSNEKSFEIVDVILAEEHGVKYSYEKNVSYMAGSRMKYEIGVDYSVNDGDMFVMQPIFVIKFEGKDKPNYFAQGMLVYDAKNLTYTEMREYVK